MIITFFLFFVRGLFSGALFFVSSCGDWKKNRELPSAANWPLLSITCQVASRMAPVPYDWLDPANTFNKSPKNEFLGLSICKKISNK